MLSELINNLSTDWKSLLYCCLQEDENIYNTLENILQEDNIVPPPPMIFNAFNHFNISDLRVIIIGQDPYINQGEAMGLCFSIPESVKTPPSLKNIFKEVEREYGIPRTSPDLTDWAKQGVLLLNTSLTTILGKSGYHIKAWKQFTRLVLSKILQSKQDVVFMLWGAFAQDIYKSLDITSGPYILKHTHPSPLSRKPFVGCGHFKACNEWLKQHGKCEIKWV